MDDRKKQDEQKGEDPQKLEDLDVPESEGEDVKGGAEPVHNYSLKQAWPKKYS